MPTGRVKYFKPEKGYGFIEPDGGAGEVFVHVSNCAEDVETLLVGQRVEFDQRTSPRSGKQEAVAVELVD